MRCDVMRCGEMGGWDGSSAAQPGRLRARGVPECESKTQHEFIMSTTVEEPTPAARDGWWHCRYRLTIHRGRPLVLRRVEGPI